ncbi:MAG TPA: iron-containing alcohol dehydrogenase, partial [Holophaga sp.]|nr:iron-containing alcohol dehydrogenase [Holophaga sp.]
MLTRFEFSTAQRIVFGSGAAGEAAGLAAGMGRRPMVVTGRDASRHGWLLDRLADGGTPALGYAFQGEPAVEEVREGARMAQEAKIDLIIAIGGGSALDGGKAIAAMAQN